MDSALETYTFEFKYSKCTVGSDGTSSCATAVANISTFDMYRNNTKIASQQLDTFSSIGEDTHVIRSATTRMLRTLIVLTQALDDLPVDQRLFISMRLMYYDAVTPADYQPVGFKHSEETFK